MSGSEGDIRCDYCGATTLDSITADKAGWDWFTGYRRDTFHACAACRKKNAADFRARFYQSQDPAQNPPPSTQRGRGRSTP